MKTFETTLKQSSPDILIMAKADLAAGVANATIVSNIVFVMKIEIKNLYFSTYLIVTALLRPSPDDSVAMCEKLVNTL